jgi:hypothetical protein
VVGHDPFTHEEEEPMKDVFTLVEAEQALPHNSASHSNALVENPFEVEAAADTEE